LISPYQLKEGQVAIIRTSKTGMYTGLIVIRYRATLIEVGGTNVWSGVIHSKLRGIELEVIEPKSLL